MARENRPELRLLGLAREAKAAETKLNKAALLPDIGARFSGVFSASNVVENQPSPFAFDPFNQRFAMLGIGVRYSLDIGAKSAKARESEAGRTQLEALQRAAQMGISLEIEKAYLDAKSASERFAAREEADKWARKWLLAVAADFTVGNAETRDLIEALVASGDSHGKYLQAIFEYNLALGALEKAAGAPVVSAPSASAP
jgi:outer membrane protein TolC